MNNQNHWAFQAGVSAGLRGDMTKRGVMSFGLSCAATKLDADNTRMWLDGFDSVVITAENTVKINDFSF